VGLIGATPQALCNSGFFRALLAEVLRKCGTDPVTVTGRIGLFEKDELSLQCDGEE
jgi:hypothetical protein